MNIKRTVGTGKIFWYSCGAVLALAGVVWLIINGIYAALISGKEPNWSWYHSKSSADTVTPWLLMAASVAISYRYMKMCSANNVSYIKQTAVFSMLSVFISTAFAAADLLIAKLVMQPIYGGIIMTKFETDCTYFLKFVWEWENYINSLNEGVTERGSPYTMNTMLLLFALMAVYYYCFFIAGCYMVRCFSYGSKKIRIYYVVMTVLGIIAFLAASEWKSLIDTAWDILLTLFIVVIIVVNVLTNPVVFLYAFPYLVLGDFETIIVGFIIMTVFIFITILSIKILGSEQFPKKRKIKKILKNYNAQNQNNYGE